MAFVGHRRTSKKPSPREKRERPKDTPAQRLIAAVERPFKGLPPEPYKETLALWIDSRKPMLSLTTPQWRDWHALYMERQNALAERIARISIAYAMRPGTGRTVDDTQERARLAPLHARRLWECLTDEYGETISELETMLTTRDPIADIKAGEVLNGVCWLGNELASLSEAPPPIPTRVMDLQGAEDWALLELDAAFWEFWDGALWSENSKGERVEGPRLSFFRESYEIVTEKESQKTGRPLTGWQVYTLLRAAKKRIRVLEKKPPKPEK